VKAEPLVQSHPAALITATAVVPLVICAVLALFRESIAGATAALVLVLVVVLAAATGVRAAGFVAALSSGLWFDFFLTEPYGSLKITDPDDVAVMVLLLLVGGAVTEIALWGRRQEARSSRRAGYLDGVLGTADLIAGERSSPDALIHRVCHQMVEILDVDACRFETGGVPSRSYAILENDGSVVHRGQRVDVDRDGLPSDDVIALDAQQGGVTYGRFLLTASTRVARPSVEQRRVVVLLADQVGAALASTAG
jgi:K+-sensing histidine kinase KdpD